VLLGVSCGFLSIDLPLTFQITLVANEDDDDVFIALRLYLLQPESHILERLEASYIIDDCSGYSTSKIGASERMIAVITGSVPKLRSDRLAVLLDEILRAEFHPEGRPDIVKGRFINEAVDEACLTRAAIANAHHFDEQVVWLWSTVHC